MDKKSYTVAMPVPRIVELNTVDPPTPGFMDETVRIGCPKCGSRLRLGHGMDYDPEVAEISEKHIELCEGDPAVTLWRIDQWWKARAHNV